MFPCLVEAFKLLLRPEPLFCSREICNQVWYCGRPNRHFQPYPHLEIYGHRPWHSLLCPSPPTQGKIVRPWYRLLCPSPATQGKIECPWYRLLCPSPPTQGKRVSLVSSVEYRTPATQGEIECPLSFLFSSPAT